MSVIEFEGLSEVLGRLENIASAEELERAMGKACAIVERDAKIKAPKGSGELRRSIQSKIEVDGTDIRGIVFSPLEYAPYVEYGTGIEAESGGRTDVPWCYQDDKGEWHTTSGMPPQPYMRPALDENREEIKRILREGLSGD
jgi:HK97 gp10 family phage protein